MLHTFDAVMNKRQDVNMNMKPIDDFKKELRSIAEEREMPEDEMKKRLLSLAGRMDGAGVPQLEKLAYRAMELVGEFPDNTGDVMNLLISCAEEDWIRVGEAARPLLDIKDIRELTELAGMKPSV